MSIQRNDWSLQRKGIIDQERHKDRVKEAIRKNLGSIVSNEAIILSDGKRTVKVPIKALDEYKFRFNHQKGKHVGQGDGKTRVGDVIGRESSSGLRHWFRAGRTGSWCRLLRSGSKHRRARRADFRRSAAAVSRRESKEGGPVAQDAVQ